MNLLNTDNLACLIEKRLRCLTQLRDLGRKQGELIAAGEMTPLLRLISAKNQLIAALQSLEQTLAPYHDQNPDERQWTSDAARSNAAKNAAECQTLLHEVMELERLNEQAMVERRDQVAHQLQTAQAATTARGAYQAHQTTKPQGPHRTPIIPIAPSDSATNGSQLDLQSEV